MFTFVNMISFPQIAHWYSQHFEARLKGRYICKKHIGPILKEYQKLGLVEVVGFSEKKEEIHIIKIGKGSKSVLAWSQMHGNESTTTKAVFDFLKFLNQISEFKNVTEYFKNTYTFYFIPILNPDGAAVYTRENANGIDLNRDASILSQKESNVLRKVFQDVKPDMCLNLHDQRTIYSLPTGRPATLSFLAPAADASLSITKSRATAMLAIADINKVLQKLLPGQIGRYNDAYNEHCVGDTFQSMGVPTLLFEAGHFPGDYDRDITRKYVFFSLLALFNLLEKEQASSSTLHDYLTIPENEMNFCDIILRKGLINGVIQDIVIQYQEKLEGEQISFVPVIAEIVAESSKMGHKEIDLGKNEILINSHENVFVNEEISTILYKNQKKSIIF